MNSRVDDRILRGSGKLCMKVVAMIGREFLSAEPVGTVYRGSEGDEFENEGQLS